MGIAHLIIDMTIDETHFMHSQDDLIRVSRGRPFKLTLRTDEVEFTRLVTKKMAIRMIQGLSHALGSVEGMVSDE